MRVSHLEHIDRWVEYIKKNPKKWRKIHTDFINSQFQNSFEKIKKLSKTKQGANKIIEIYDITNLKGYKKLLKN